MAALTPEARPERLDAVTHGAWRSLAERRAEKEATSLHAFLRGTAPSFYEWLSERRIPAGPPIWICGDLHVGNLGPIANARGDVSLEVRDLDQTVLGNPAYDVIRLAFSLATVALAAGLDGTVMLDMLAGCATGYRHGVLGRRGVERPTAVQFAMKKALHRSWRELLEERDVERARLPRTGRFLSLTRTARSEIERLVHGECARELVTLLRCRDDDARVRFRDAAFWVKGCSSLGSLRVAALVSVEGATTKNGGVALLDFKEARPSCAPPARRLGIPDAERVVLGARALCPELGHRMLATTILGRSTFVRELLPQDLKLELENIPRGDATNLAAYLAHVVGRAHGRQMDRRARAEWARAVGAKKSSHVPAWLWTEVSALLALQARAYLRHCASLREERRRAP